MSFRELYDLCQEQLPPIGRTFLKENTLKITGVPSVRHFRASMEDENARGFFIHATNKDNQFVKQAGTHVIVTRRGENTCWERFIYTKELMHLFDKSSELTASGQHFDDLLSDFLGNTVVSSPQMGSEIKCFWRAMAVLCPEKLRQEYIKSYNNKEINHYDVALALRMPEQYVPLYFTDRYKGTIDSLLSE